MKKHLRWLVLSSACLGMGLSVPSCPGQQALQQQIDSIEKRETSTAQKLQALDTQVKQLSGDLAKATQLMQTMGQTVVAQKTELETLQKSMAELASRGSKTSAGAKKTATSAAASRGKKHR